MIHEPAATDRRLQPPTRRRLAWVAMLVALLLAGAGAWWAWARAEPAIPADRLRIAEVVRGDIVRDVQAQGRLVAAGSPTLYAPAAGTVVLAAQAGDTVRAGQVLARVESPELLAEHDREAATLGQLEADLGRQGIVARQQQLAAEREADEAQLALRAAERDRQRSAEACAAGVVAQVDCLRLADAVDAGRVRSAHATRRVALVAAESDFERRSLQQRMARQRALRDELARRLDTLTVRAPVDARIGSIAVADRAAVAANAPLMTVVDLSRLEVELQVPEAAAADLVPDLPVALRIGTDDVAGRLVAIAPEVRAGQVQLRVRFDGAQPPGLRQNQRLSGRIVLEQRPGVLTLPRGPFVDAQGGHAAWVLAGEHAELRRIRLGALGVAAVEVAEGLQAGERVVIAGTEHFARGATRVRIRP
ncbi:MAG: efflux RND transporter periplasmic adaptor subunit [Burkholderiaceae bacterium]|nr:efflux RND transporter periplasmic adaptor subunit [Burkholderiaceae bacterium]